MKPYIYTIENRETNTKNEINQTEFDKKNIEDGGDNR